MFTLSNNLVPLLALGALITPSLSQSNDRLSCIDDASDGVIYESAAGKYEIMCATDYGGGDMGATSAATFEGCIAACDASPGCIDVSYVGTACYLKDRLNTALNWGHVWTAKKIIEAAPPASGSGSGSEPGSGSGSTPTSASPAPAATKLTCKDNLSDGTTYTATNGIWQIMCATDYGGGDMGVKEVSSFENCIQACDSTAGCIDVSFVNTACYMKNRLGEALPRGHVWTAKWIAKVESPSSPSPSASAGSGSSAPSDGSSPAPAGSSPAGSSPTTTSATSSSSSSSPTSGPLSCRDNKSHGMTHTATSGGLWEILCGTDYAGGDMGAQSADTFEACIDLCDKTEGCIDVSFVYTACYMKNKLNEALPRGHVWTAKLLKSAAEIVTFPEAKGTDQGTGVESILPGPTTLESPPLATLAPLAPPGVDMGSLTVLNPKPETQLWYNGGGSQGNSSSNDTDADTAVTVRLSIAYQYPSVVLDHSIYIQSVGCAAGSLSATINNTKAFSHSANEWPAIPKLLFITSSPDCGVDGQNAFFLAESIKFDASRMTFVASGKMVELGDVFEDIGIDFGNIQPSNSSSNSNSTAPAVCGSPSSSVVNGLPAVACGDDFDKILDEHLGFYSEGNTDAVLAAASPGLDSQHPLERRFFGKLVSAVKSVAKAVVDTGKKAVAAVKEVAKDVGNKIVDVGKQAVNFAASAATGIAKLGLSLATNAFKIGAFIVTGKYSNTMNLPINLGPPAHMQEDSPWGPAFKFYTWTRAKEDPKFQKEQTALGLIQEQLKGEEDPEPGIELWCVNCGVKGHIRATGSITATALSGLTQGKIDVDGNMRVGAYIGVNAFAAWEKTVKKDLLVQGLPGWSIPGIVTLGPQLRLGVQATIAAEAQGQILTGASLNWPNLKATVDFVDSRRSATSGWTPIVDKKFEAHGEVTATAALGLPVTVSFGIDILKGRFRKGVDLTDTPAIVAKAEFEVDLADGELTVGNDECQGIAWDISLSNQVTLAITDIREWTLAQWAGPTLAKGCIGRPRVQAPVTSITIPTASMVTTTRATSTALSTSVSQPVSGREFCPGSNGQTFTDRSGNLYLIQCRINYANDAGQLATDDPNMEECINSCSKTSWCVGISYGLTLARPCHFKRDVLLERADSYLGFTVYSARRVSPFTILSAFYSDRDITALAQARFRQGSKLVINTNNMHANYGTGDPFPGMPKSITVLYTYGAETRVFTARDNTGIFEMVPGPVELSRNSQIVASYPRPASGGGFFGSVTASLNWAQIVSVVWGSGQIRNQGVYNALYTSIRAGTTFPLSNEFFAEDTWYGVGKTAIIWYRDARQGADGPLLVMTGRENGVGQFVRPATPVPAGLSKRQDNGTAEETVEITDSATPEAASTTDSATSVTSSAATEFPSISDSNSTATSNTTSFTPATVRVTDTSNTLILNTAKNGNLFISAADGTTDMSTLAGPPLAADKGTSAIFGDGEGRLLHYYPTTMTVTGTSRLRLADWDKLPKTAVLINLVPVTAADTTMLMAIDASGNYFWPFMCGMKDGLNKVFLVKGSETGAKVLEGEGLKFSVTGGVVGECGPLALNAVVGSEIAV
ncbi:hypothetical protein H2199_008568 [Coniosporium tulheliwenetii]|uniref:Uncharacterized protein n=1 Tax=Coniosporium tulheliwenetii TaxID=3383036 RepID=A0ACC2YIF7_9PEZI|nr:hypothetical protein H2199_008568 [Cladosporium sp. JES 115]